MGPLLQRCEAKLLKMATGIFHALPWSALEETSHICPDGSQPVAPCQCAAHAWALAAIANGGSAAADAVLRAQRETKARSGVVKA
jgi:hypothetical protein